MLGWTYALYACRIGLLHFVYCIEDILQKDVGTVALEVRSVLIQELAKDAGVALLQAKDWIFSALIMVFVLKSNAQKYADNVSNTDLNIVKLIIDDALQSFQQ